MVHDAAVHARRAVSRALCLSPLAALPVRLPGAAGRGAAASPAPRVSWDALPPTPALPRPDASGILQGQGGARLFHAQFGPRPAAGEPVLLLHGGLANSDWWGHLVPVLATNRRVVALDTRGHGRSTLGDAGLSYPVLAGDALAVLDALGISRAAAVGWSDGGIAGLAMAMSAPARVARLFLFGANSSRSGGRSGGQAEPTVRAYLARCAEEYRALSPVPQDFGRLRQALSAMWRSGPEYGRARLAAIRAPTTVAVAERDELILPAHARALATAIPGAALVELPNVSHFAMLQDPRGFAAAVLRSLAG